jgi:hypothetical protein
MLLVTKGFKESLEDPLWKKFVVLPFLPALVVWVLIHCCLSIPYFWLYPENHMTMIDCEGTEEEKRRLQDYRLACGKKGLLRRLIEKIGWAQRTGPEWPFQDDEPIDHTDR